MMFSLLFVGLCVCLSVSRIMRKQTDQFSLNLAEGCSMGQGRTHYILERILISARIHKLFFTFVFIVRESIMALGDVCTLGVSF